MFGENILEERKGVSAFKILARQFKNALILILILATIASASLGEVIDALVILIIVGIVVGLGFFQEHRTEGTLQALKKMQALYCSVAREGERKRVRVENLVPGDIVILEAGDRVSADMRILESFDLKIDEAAMTGESRPVEKNPRILSAGTQLAERTNSAFAGTVVLSGKGKAVVVATAMSTELGQIAKSTVLRSGQYEPPTALEQKMNDISKKLGKVLLIVIALVVFSALVEQLLILGNRIGVDAVVSIVLFGIALAVAAVPEALPAILTGNLAISAHRMSKRNALARNLSVVETLGVTQVICTDKTGTLTKGEMTVRELYLSGLTLDVSGVGYDPSGQIRPRGGGVEGEDIRLIEALHDLARAGLLCNDASLKKTNGDKWLIQGDPTEGALVVLAEKAGLSEKKIRSASPRVWELPFTSETKRMTTVHLEITGTVAYMKGAPESILECCDFVQSLGNEVPLTPESNEEILRISDSMAARSLRVLALARKDVSDLNFQSSGKSETDVEEEELERSRSLKGGFTFLGLVGIIDPPREEVASSILTAREAGIETVMITGDHRTTAVAIASEIGIYNETSDMVLTGKELEQFSDNELDAVVQKVKVYARVSPSHKLRIVNSWKRRGRTVAMTGDGVNDAPALKRADVGIAMGITGTEVAKEASDLILLDDNFATIVDAIETGRGVHDNIRKYLAYLLSANLVEVTVLSLGALLVPLLIGIGASSTSIYLPLLAVQLLYVNLVTDGLPAIALGLGPPDPGIMKKRASQIARSSVFDRQVNRFIIITICLQTPILLLAYATFLPVGIDEARTRLFLILVFSELTLALNCTSLALPFNKVKLNRWLLISTLWEITLLSALIAIPGSREALHLVLPTMQDVAWVVVACLGMFVSIDLLKRLQKE